MNTPVLEAGASLSELNEFQGVYRPVPLSFCPPQRKIQLLGARFTAAHQNQPADPEGDPDDHAKRREPHETEQETKKQC